jgi:hypothetical protein
VNEYAFRYNHRDDAEAMFGRLPTAQRGYVAESTGNIPLLGMDKG